MRGPASPPRDDDEYRGPADWPPCPPGMRPGVHAWAMRHGIPFVDTRKPTSSAAPARGPVEAGAHVGADPVVPPGQAAGKAGGEHGFGQGFLLFRDRGRGAEATEADGAGIAVHIDRGAGDVSATCEIGQMVGRDGETRLVPFRCIDPEQAYRLTPDFQCVAVDDAGWAGEDVADGGFGAGRSRAGRCHGGDDGEGHDRAAAEPGGRARGILIGLLALIGGVVVCIIVALVADDAGRGGGRGDVVRLSHGATVSQVAEPRDRTSAVPVRHGAPDQKGKQS